MASPEPTFGSVAPTFGSAHPALLAPGTPRAIADALVASERIEFERDYGEEMRLAAQTLDLTRVLAVLENWRAIAELTQRQGVEAHERMLAVVADLQAGRHVPTVGAAEAKAAIAARLAR